MKKRIYIIGCLLVLVSQSLLAQFSEGFDKLEMKEMIAIANSFTFQDVLQSDKKIIPKTFRVIYQSEPMGLDNKWQLLEGNKYAVINIRGSSSKQLSWLANMYSALIPANGQIILPKNKLVDYYLSDNPKAAVHSGWTLSMIFLSKDIVEHIKELNKQGVYYFIITGHSQGAAIAQLLRAYLENAPENLIDPNNKFKTYAFASPKVGNDFFAINYANNYLNSSFIVNNPSDPITSMPITLDNKALVNKEDIEDHIQDTTKNYFKSIAFRALGKMFLGNSDSTFVRKSGVDVHRRIELSTGRIVMPQYILGMNYHLTVKPRYISSFTDEKFRRKKYYKKFNMDPSSMFYQHKPYLYFLEILSEYFPNEYRKW